MVLSAIAKPRPEYNFDGLIGIWRITEDYVAQRSSKNHARGDVYKIGTTVTADSYYDLMTKDVIPAVRNKMNFTDNIVIQQDNARPHVGKRNVERIDEFGAVGGSSISVMKQPALSPELNTNDLGFFHSLSSRIEKSTKGNIEELWQKMQDAYYAYDASALSSLWGVKSAVIQEIIKARGASINIPHTGVRNSLL